MEKNSVLVGSLTRLLAEHVDLELQTRGYLWATRRTADELRLLLMRRNFGDLQQMTDRIAQRLCEIRGLRRLTLADITEMSSGTVTQPDTTMVSAFGALSSGHEQMLRNLDFLDVISDFGEDDVTRDLLEDLKHGHIAMQNGYATGTLS